MGTVVRLCRLRLTVSLYFEKLNAMLTHSDFIFSKFFSREYSLLAVAPMGSSLEGRQGQQRDWRETAKGRSAPVEKPFKALLLLNFWRTCQRPG